MRPINRVVSTSLLGLSLAAASLSSHAAVEWVFANGCISGCGTPFNGNVREYGSAGTSVFASAWSDTGAGGDLQTQKLYQYSGGLGVTNRGESGSSPNHSTDNAGYLDSVLFDFDGQAVTLEQVKIGWKQTDADITLMAYTGIGAPNLAGGYDYASLAANGWTHVGDYSNLVSGSNKTVNDGGLQYASSYWLISAFNSQVSSASLSTGNDYFKLYSVAGSFFTPTTNHPVPEPGSLALLGLTLPLLGWRRRRERV
jgi:hypothetical protein